MIGPRMHYGPLDTRSGALFAWDSREIEGVQGPRWRAVTGQMGAFARASAALAVDSRSAPYSVPAGRTALSWGSDGIPRLCIRPADGGRAVESFAFPFSAPIGPHCGFVSFVDRGWAAMTNARALVWGDAGSTSTPRLRLFRTGSAVTVAVLDGSSTLQTGVGVGAGVIDPGDLVEVWWELTSTTLQVGISIRGEAPSYGSVQSGSPALPFTPSAPELHLGGREGLNVGGMELGRVIIWPDHATLEELRHAW